MALSETIKAYIDWDDDGFTEADRVDAVVERGAVTVGITDPDGRVAQIGTLSLTLDNSDQEYSPLNTGATEYGNLIPGKAIQVTATDDTPTTVELFTGEITRIAPDSNLYGPRFVTIEAADRMARFQRDTDLTFPLRENVTADELLGMITASVFGGATATGEIWALSHLHDGDQVIIGSITYTFKDTLTPSAYEVETDGQYTRAAGMWDEMVNLSDAINAGPGAGTTYAAATLRHPLVGALGYPAIGVPDSERDTSVNIGDIATGYTRLGSMFAFGGVLNDSGVANEPNEMPFRRIWIPLWKAGSPSGRTVTVSLELPIGAGGAPSGSLGYVGAQVTFDADTLSSTSGTYIEVDFPDSVIDEYAIAGTSQFWWVTVAIDGTASATDYIIWGADAGGYSDVIRTRESHYTGGAWSTPASTNVPILWLPGICDITASAAGTWGNGIQLFTETVHIDADSVTVNTGSIASGSITDTETADQVYLQLNEVGGTPGFDYEFDFSGLGSNGQTVHIIGYYDGSIAHTVNVDAYNGSTWDTLGQLPAASEDTEYDFALSATHTIAGAVTIRIQHTSAGNPNHDLYIDHIYITTVSGSTIEDIEVSGTHLSGGTEGITTDYETGTQTFAYAGDQWASDDDTNAMGAVRDVVDSEYGWFVVARDGTPTFRNKNLLFEAANATPFALDNTQADIMNPRVSREDLRNVVSVSYAPRRTLTSGTIAETSRSYKADAGTGTDRWSPDVAAADNATVIQLPFKDPTTERMMSAQSVEPLIAGTHYDVTDEAGGGGTSYNSNPNFRLTYFVTGSSIEITLVNETNRALYVHDLYVEGVGLVAYDQELILKRDDSSVNTYGKLAYNYLVPLPAPETFVNTLAQHLLNARSSVQFLIDGVYYDVPDSAGASHLFNTDLLDLIAVSDDQLSIDAQKYTVVGAEYQFAGGAVSDVTFFTRDVGTNTYWQLGTTNFSELGDTTRLAL
jgi:hypothetical protein